MNEAVGMRIDDGTTDSERIVLLLCNFSFYKKTIFLPIIIVSFTSTVYGKTNVFPLHPSHHQSSETTFLRSLALRDAR
jgi:hypothetical protein